jgi:hypothetical protein
MDEIQLSPIQFSPEWIEFFIVLGAIVAVSLLATIWFVFVRRGRKKRRHRPRHHNRRRRERRSNRATLADTGGLPPVRGEEPGSPPP